MPRLIRLALISLASMFTVAALYAGTYNFTTTTPEDNVIARMRAFSNANNLFGATPAAPYATDLLFVNAMCRAKILEIREIARSQSESFENAWASSNSATKDSVCVTLGLSAGCKP